MPADPATAPASIGDLVGRLSDDLATLDRELSEIDLLITQARSEAVRHESRRSAAADKLESTPLADHKERLEHSMGLVPLTKRAALMESQVEVLEGKRRAIGRYREAVAGYLAAITGVDPTTPIGEAASGADGGIEPGGPLPVAVSRIVLSAQEDMRREIARAMHDGPAQSLTNIVLQAQIVERLMTQEPASAGAEVHQLIAMVQQTLDATKSFIFDVRPMVLDDLGLVPTLRRAARERGRRAATPVDFDSMGQDRRLDVDLESGLFRIVDEALAAYLDSSPDRVAVRLDWGDRLEAHVTATRAVAEPPKPAAGDVPIPTEDGKDLPPALAALVEQRRAAEKDAAEAAVRDAIVVLPDAAWRDIQGRAASIGIEAQLLADGGDLRLVAEVPPLEGATR